MAFLNESEQESPRDRLLLECDALGGRLQSLVGKFFDTLNVPMAKGGKKLLPMPGVDFAFSFKEKGHHVDPEHLPEDMKKDVVEIFGKDIAWCLTVKREDQVEDYTFENHGCVTLRVGEGEQVTAYSTSGWENRDMMEDEELEDLLSRMKKVYEELDGYWVKITDHLENTKKGVRKKLKGL